jgi:hypothetical protein
MPLWVSWAERSALRRFKPASSRASQRATSTSCVLLARRSHQPSAVFTRTPSTSETLAPLWRSRAFTSYTVANFRSSRQGKPSSGVLIALGS